MWYARLSLDLTSLWHKKLFSQCSPDGSIHLMQFFSLIVPNSVEIKLKGEFTGTHKWLSRHVSLRGCISSTTYEHFMSMIGPKETMKKSLMKILLLC